MNFGDWYREHQTEITWFLIGWLCWGGIDQLARGNYIMSAIDFGIAYLNYRMWKL